LQAGAYEELEYDFICFFLLLAFAFTFCLMQKVTKRSSRPEASDSYRDGGQRT
jgi:hypothetical protein